MYPICTCLYLGFEGNIRIDSPDCPIHGTPKIEIDSMVLSKLMRSAADSLQVANSKGMKTVYVSRDMTLRDFMRFCLGTDELGDSSNETKNT